MTYREARDRMIDAKMIVSRKYQEQQWRALRVGAHPQILEFGNYLVAKLKKLNIPVFANEYVRTAERQKHLKATGMSDAGPANGPHVWGCAVDIVHSVHGWSLSKKQWEFIGKLGKELAVARSIPIVWGGDWPPIVEKVGWDPAHWQLKHWRQEMSGFPFMPPNNGDY